MIGTKWTPFSQRVQVHPAWLIAQVGSWDPLYSEKGLHCWHLNCIRCRGWMAGGSSFFHITYWALLIGHAALLLSLLRLPCCPQFYRLLDSIPIWMGCLCVKSDWKAHTIRTDKVIDLDRRYETELGLGNNNRKLLGGVVQVGLWGPSEELYEFLGCVIKVERHWFVISEVRQAL